MDRQRESGFTEQFLLCSKDAKLSLSNRGLARLWASTGNDGNVRVSGFLFLRTCVVGIFSAGPGKRRKRRFQTEIVSLIPLSFASRAQKASKGCFLGV